MAENQTNSLPQQTNVFWLLLGVLVLIGVVSLYFSQSFDLGASGQGIGNGSSLKCVSFDIAPECLQPTILNAGERKNFSLAEVSKDPFELPTSDVGPFDSEQACLDSYYINKEMDTPRCASFCPLIPSDLNYVYEHREAQCSQVPFSCKDSDPGKYYPTDIDHWYKVKYKQVCIFCSTACYIYDEFFARRKTHTTVIQLKCDTKKAFDNLPPACKELTDMPFGGTDSCQLFVYTKTKTCSDNGSVSCPTFDGNPGIGEPPIIDNAFCDVSTNSVPPQFVWDIDNYKKCSDAIYSYPSSKNPCTLDFR